MLRFNGVSGLRYLISGIQILSCSRICNGKYGHMYIFIFNATLAVAPTKVSWISLNVREVH